MTYVYIVQCPQTKNVKIGQTSKKNPFERIKSLNTSSPCPLKVLYIFEDQKLEYNLESHLHDKYRKWNIHREWFASDILKDLEEYSKSLKSCSIDEDYFKRRIKEEFGKMRADQELAESSQKVRSQTTTTLDDSDDWVKLITPFQDWVKSQELNEERKKLNEEKKRLSEEIRNLNEGAKNLDRDQLKQNLIDLWDQFYDASSLYQYYAKQAEINTIAQFEMLAEIASFKSKMAALQIKQVKLQKENIFCLISTEDVSCFFLEQRGLILKEEIQRLLEEIELETELINTQELEFKKIAESYINLKRRNTRIQCQYNYFLAELEDKKLEDETRE